MGFLIKMRKFIASLITINWSHLHQEFDIILSSQLPIIQKKTITTHHYLSHTLEAQQTLPCAGHSGFIRMPSDLSGGLGHVT